MKLNISYGSHSLSATVTSPITIQDITSSIKQTLNIPNTNLSVIDESNQILNTSEVILPQNDMTKNLYIINTLLSPSTQKVETSQPSIEDLIMQVTEASDKIVLNKKPAATNTNMNILEQLSNESNSLERLLNLLQGLESRNIQFRINNQQQPLEPNENYVRELKDMGFPEERARDALIRARNNISRATDILLNGDDEGGNNQHSDGE